MSPRDEQDFQSAAAFPQRSIIDAPKGTSNPTTERTQRRDGPNVFREEENVQFKFVKDLMQHELQLGGVILHLSTLAQLNRTTQTHDTAMYQFLEQPDVSGSVICRITFPTPYIFRATIVKSMTDMGNVSDDTDFPPLSSKMIPFHLRHEAFQVKTFSEYVAILTSAIEVRAYRTPFTLRAYQRDIIPLSTVEHEGRSAFFEAFTLRSGERIYGLGQRFDSVDRVGRTVDFVNHDAIGTSNTRSYINVPFFWCTSGYGCFINSSARTEFDIATSEQGTVGFSVEDALLDYFIVAGRDPKEILARYTQDLTGTAPILLVWTFGVWLSRNSYQSWDVVDKIIEKCDELSIPVDTLHLDTFWFRQNWNPDYIFDPNRFADPEAKMAVYKKAGLHISLWISNCAPPRDDNLIYTEGLARSFFATNAANSNQPYAYPPGTRGTWTDDYIIDFSSPAATAWFTTKISHLISRGASAIKTDFSDYIPPAAHYANISGQKFQNLYSLYYTSSIYNALKTVDKETIIWARPGTAGSQRYPVHWGGDSQCSWSGLQGTLKGSLSIGLSGFGYHSHDIGGFIGKPSVELYIRWAQFGLLSSHSRAHGSGDENGREPWFFGKEAVSVFRKFARLKYRLLPYIVEQARIGAPRGLPLVRAMILEFPHERSCWQCEEQYMFGESLLVAPILEAAEICTEKTVYLPRGLWYDFWTKEKTESSGEWIVIKDTPLDIVPMWVRAGAVLPFAVARTRTSNTIGKIDCVEVYKDPGLDHRRAVKYGENETYIEIDLERRVVTGKEHMVNTMTKVVDII